jgi:hypothetical protein
MVDENTGYCARKDKEFTLQYPSGMVGFRAWDRADHIELGSKLDECHELGKLPRDDKTLANMHICIVGATCPSAINGWFSTPPEDFSKIKSKLEWCTRR